MDWKLFAATFGTLFVAELGDKTQLACILMASESRKPWTVFAASSLALVCVSLLGVVLAEAVCRFVQPEVMRKIAAAGFMVIGALILMDWL
jgi:putative Ca2+/H+ antiporter (TMEM165/GDT1 family)